MAFDAGQCVRASVDVHVQRPCVCPYVRMSICPSVSYPPCISAREFVHAHVRYYFFINCDLSVKIPGGSIPTTPVITEPVREFIVSLGRLDIAHLHIDLTLIIP